MAERATIPGSSSEMPFVLWLACLNMDRARPRSSFWIFLIWIFHFSSGEQEQYDAAEWFSVVVKMAEDRQGDLRVAIQVLH